jgi:hypothetical protein
VYENGKFLSLTLCDKTLSLVSHNVFTDPDALGYFPDPGLVPNDAVFSELYSHVPFRFDLSPLSSENPVYMPNQVYQVRYFPCVSFEFHIV